MTSGDRQVDRVRSERHGARDRPLAELEVAGADRVGINRLVELDDEIDVPGAVKDPSPRGGLVAVT